MTGFVASVSTFPRDLVEVGRDWNKKDVRLNERVTGIIVRVIGISAITISTVGLFQARTNIETVEGMGRIISGVALGILGFETVIVGDNICKPPAHHHRWRDSVRHRSHPPEEKMGEYCLRVSRGTLLLNFIMEAVESDKRVRRRR